MSDWMPSSRTEILTMARNWSKVMVPAKITAWSIPPEQYNDLDVLRFAAEAVFEKATSDTNRTPVITAQCNAAFKALEEKMRFFKKHYFLLPPLTDADLVSLGLKPADTIKTAIPPPNAEAVASIGLVDTHLIDIRDIRPRLAHSTDPRSDWAADIHIGIVDGAGPYRIDTPPEPETGGKLPFAKTTRRRRERFDLEGNSGKTAWFSLAFRNEKGEVGPFCPAFPAIVP